ncbi:hypothetical protein NT6N_26660 [Oceaniferula spumae]|uniref:Asparagine synthase n=1 Tax=Oceaniferula spumae TaxID=2979115 RepID=A0AAT9FNQ8_9BACT
MLKSFADGKMKVTTLKQLNKADRELVQRIKDNRLTYLSDKKLCQIVNMVKTIEASSIPGVIIEAGCALGGSAILIAKTKSVRRSLRVYDVFGMIPPPTVNDTPDVHERYDIISEGKSSGLGGDKYYGYEENLYAKVVSNFESFAVMPDKDEVELIKGLVQDTLYINGSVALAHIDVDWYDPVMICLQRIYPKLSVGGAIILDDYHDWGGCRKATDEFLQQVVGTYDLDDTSGSMTIIKKTAD